jgi:uncharacterized protein
MLLLHSLPAVLSGALVGFTLGLIGGGGSIMATPLLLYVVGLQPHVAIGTGAVAVSANAFANVWGHARAGNVRWRCALLFSAVGVAGAAIGSAIGRHVEGQHLLFLFAILMIVIGVLMLRRRGGAQTESSTAPTPSGLRSFRPLVVVATAVGTLSGFFGIGGGFLIMPGLRLSTGMPTICAIGSSLLVVGTFGLTTAVTYGWSGLIDWPVAAEYLVGGLAGGVSGMWLATGLARRKAVLDRIFAGVVFLVAGYMLYRNGLAMGL